MKRKWMILTLTCVVVMSATRPVSAQPAPRPNVMVRAYNGQQDPATAQLIKLAPGNPTPLSVTDLANPNGNIALSADGQWAAVVTYDTQSIATITYGLSGQSGVAYTAEPNLNILQPIFSPDNRFLSYSIANFAYNNWQLVIVDLSTGAKKTFGGMLDFSGTPAPPDGFIGVPVVVGWNPDGKRLYLVPLAIEGAAGGPFEVDLSAIPFVPADQPSAPAAMPPVRQLLTADKVSWQASYFFSPDQSKMLFAYFDATRPVKDWTGYGDPSNTIGMLDLLTGELRLVAQAPQDEAISTVTWSADASRVLFVAARFINNESGPTMEAPKLYVVDMASSQVGAGIVLTADPAESVYAMLSCGDQLFYSVTRQDAAGGFSSSLFSAPLADLNARSGPLLTGPTAFDFITCVP